MTKKRQSGKQSVQLENSVKWSNSFSAGWNVIGITILENNLENNNLENNLNIYNLK